MSSLGEGVSLSLSLSLSLLSIYVSRRGSGLSTAWRMAKTPHPLQREWRESSPLEGSIRSIYRIEKLFFSKRDESFLFFITKGISFG